MPEGEHHYSGFDDEHRRWGGIADAGGDLWERELWLAEQAALADVRGYGSSAAHPKESADPGDVENLLLEAEAGYDQTET